MARQSIARTSGTSANGHPAEPANAEGTPATVPLIPTHSPDNDDDDDDDEGPRFDFDVLRKRYPGNVAPVPHDSTLLSNGSRSLTSIGLQAFGCGFTLAACLLLTLYLTVEKQDPIWRLPAFFACLSIFHFLEYYITARFNLPTVRAASFLLFNNGTAYNAAHTCAALEIIVTRYWFPDFQRVLVYPPYSILLGLGIVAIGQVARSTAMAQAGTNFNHTPVQTRKDGHELVTHGIYSWSRHPSYFGFFWWALGTQVLVGNKVCLVAYAVALWRFFYTRVIAEERTLVEFFGDDYREYRKRVGTRIPFVP
ncbi:farnesyl cysteine-carboxyl methyltransferase [Friedmanniomyces endolithicus]|uniref:Protein-S-isoprenylcysteine O-methyltransferase n=1 Tax=Friedmanniomyces endolithicus TaxID=329885 RepID=A0A4U0U339_9PEZI|nr:farnesyl cysteine-carboxyl methyltransferase [Friedmanniomyces endolithicus]KAK0310480.1 farnesyl cysteine-carboxyl methyltransferase [Friedmanniomyces endolithicus]KAK0835883.1 farnesyl cysteine-carboxyl methyltransferase [Friedmanniomyces endolithicus]KAK0919141.1 farnesyl cysteine-carboxyl methyltransferase [Friedmanniomyces endolithicus]KAK0961356.1 farnesyl cysteine-carboxyl methyltransferase [Friedmanniomyces endolithicus]